MTFYDDFISKVADGRDGLKKSDVDKIGQGRVWSGKEALDIALIDEIGELDDAINYAAELVDVENIKLLNLPKSENNELLEIFQSFEMSNNSSIINDDFIKKIKNIFSQIKETKSMDKYQTRLPFEIIID